MEGTGPHTAPSLNLLLSVADKVTVYGQRDRLQAIAENSVAHLIRSLTENRHTEPPDFEIQR